MRLRLHSVFERRPALQSAGEDIRPSNAPGGGVCVFTVKLGMVHADLGGMKHGENKRDASYLLFQLVSRSPFAAFAQK